MARCQGIIKTTRKNASTKSINCFITKYPMLLLNWNLKCLSWVNRERWDNVDRENGRMHFTSGVFEKEIKWLLLQYSRNPFVILWCIEGLGWAQLWFRELKIVRPLSVSAEEKNFYFSLERCKSLKSRLAWPLSIKKKLNFLEIS